MTSQAASAARGEAVGGPRAGRYRRAPHGRRRQDDRHRAARVARARGGRGPRRRGRAPHAGHRAPARAATCGCPASARARCPPPVVIQRIGREAVLDEAVRGALGPLVRRRDRRRRHPPGRRSRRSTSATCPAEGQPLTFTIEIGVRPTAHARRRTRASRSAKREPGADDEAVDAELEQLRERAARLETVERGRRRGRLRRHGLRRLDRRRARSRAARAATSCIELGSGRLDPRLRGAAHGRQGRRRAHRRRHASPTTTAPSDLAGKDAAVRGHGQGGQAQGPARARRRLRLRRRRLRHARRAARGHRAPSCARPTRQRVEAEFREAVLDAVVDDAKVEVPEALVEARAQRAVGAHAALARPPGHRQGGLPADRRQATRRRSSRRPSPTPSRRCAARPSSPRSSRPRASRPPTATSSTRCRRPPRARARRPRSCASAREGGPPRRAARGPRPARRRSTCWPSTRRRYPSSRPRRVTSCGRRADKAATTRRHGCGRRARAISARGDLNRHGNRPTAQEDGR